MENTKEINDNTICKRCEGLGVIYTSRTSDGLYWNTADCPDCHGTGSEESQKENFMEISNGDRVIFLQDVVSPSGRIRARKGDAGRVTYVSKVTNYASVLPDGKKHIIHDVHTRIIEKIEAQ